MWKCILSSFFLLTFITSVQSQSAGVELKVYGSCAYIPKKVGQTIKIEIVVDKNKCDPETGFQSIEDILFHFDGALKAKGIAFSEFTRLIAESKTKGTTQTVIYTYSGTEQEIESIAELAGNQEIQVKNVQYKYEERALEDQDDNAICALEDATSRAKHIAKVLGYKECILRAVDDETSSMSYWGSSYSLLTREQMLGGANTYGILGYFELY